MIKVLVTGGNGQLANCIKDVGSAQYNVQFKFVDVEELDITNQEAVRSFFKASSFDYCINCAAYTAVDLAESNIEPAEKINVDGPRILAYICKEHNTVLIHISTDFVFDGLQTRPYKEEDKANPINIYGATKLHGEKAIAKSLKEHIILRTSWLYSEDGQNFLKTMLRLGSERDRLGVVADQIGTPTYAGDLAKVLLTIVSTENRSYGIYHYSNEGLASWYDFAKAIFDIANMEVVLSPINTKAYPSPAKRPRFSVMDKSKIKSKLGVEIPYWRDSLKECTA